MIGNGHSGHNSVVVCSEGDLCDFIPLSCACLYGLKRLVKMETSVRFWVSNLIHLHFEASPSLNPFILAMFAQMKTASVGVVHSKF